MSSLSHNVDKILSEAGRKIADGAPHEHRYGERLLKVRDPLALSQHVADQIVGRSIPGDTVVWRHRPAINKGRCYFRFAIVKTRDPF